MNKFGFLLFIALISVCCAGTLAFGSYKKEPCPQWASELGKYCETQSYTIVSNENFKLDTWQMGLLVLTNAKVTMYENLGFYTLDGKAIDANKMKQGDYYLLIKITPGEAKFQLAPIDATIELEAPDCYLTLAKSQ